MKVDLFSDEVFGAYGPGVHYNISDEDYHEIKAVSNSSLKIAKRSMRHFKHWLDGGSMKKTDAMVFGSLLHMAVLEPERFDKEVIKSDTNDKRTKDYKDLKKEHPDKIVLTLSEVKKIDDMVDEIKSQNHCAELIKEGATEVAIFTTCKDTGLKIKMKMDFISTNPDKPYILDYKTTLDCKPGDLPKNPDDLPRPSKFERQSYDLGYCNQAAFYLHFAKQEKLKAEFFVLLAQEKDAPYLAQPYVVGFESIQEADKENKELLQRIASCARDDMWPGYSSKRLTLKRPHWGFSDD